MPEGSKEVQWTWLHYLGSPILSCPTACTAAPAPVVGVTDVHICAIQRASSAGGEVCLPPCWRCSRSPGCQWSRGGEGGGVFLDRGKEWEGLAWEGNDTGRGLLPLSLSPASRFKAHRENAEQTLWPSVPRKIREQITKKNFCDRLNNKTTGSF